MGVTDQSETQIRRVIRTLSQGKDELLTLEHLTRIYLRLRPKFTDKSFEPELTLFSDDSRLETLLEETDSVQEKLLRSCSDHHEALLEDAHKIQEVLNDEQDPATLKAKVQELLQHLTDVQ